MKLTKLASSQLYSKYRMPQKILAQKLGKAYKDSVKETHNTKPVEP